MVVEEIMKFRKFSIDDCMQFLHFRFVDIPFETERMRGCRWLLLFAVVSWTPFVGAHDSLSCSNQHPFPLQDWTFAREPQSQCVQQAQSNTFLKSYLNADLEQKASSASFATAWETDAKRSSVQHSSPISSLFRLFHSIPSCDSVGDKENAPDGPVQDETTSNGRIHKILKKELNLDLDVFPSFEEWRQSLSVDSAVIVTAANEAAEEFQADPSPTATLPVDVESLTEETPIQFSFPESLPRNISLQGGSVGSGTKLAKDSLSARGRFNFASFDCGAVVMASNPGAQRVSSILKENKDEYMLNHCDSPEHYVIVELCEEILVDTVHLANYEFFSSVFSHVRIAVSDRYPPKKEWTVVAEVDAKNVRQIQTFNVQHPRLWARFIRLDILSHYGHEHFCPISVLRVFGKTMMEDLRKSDDEFEEEKMLKIEETAKNNPRPAVLNKATTTPIVLSFTNESHTSTLIEPSVSISTSASESIGEASLIHFSDSAMNTKDDSSTAVTTDSIIFETNSPTRTSSASSFIQQQQQTPLLSPSPGHSQSASQVHGEQSLPSTTSIPPPRISTIDSERSASTQDSVFKVMMKRLSRVEETLNLSITYIEHQSHRIKEALHRLEDNHTKYIEQYLLNLESAVLSGYDNIVSPNRNEKTDVLRR